MKSEEATSNRKTLPKEEPVRLNDWVEPAMWVFALVSVCAGIFLLQRSPSPEARHGGLFQYLYGIAWLFFGLYAARMARAGVIVYDYGVTVRTPFRTWKCGWSEISVFKLQRAAPRPGLRVVLSSGKEIRAIGLVGRSEAERRLAERFVLELNHRALPRSPN